MTEGCSCNEGTTVTKRSPGWTLLTWAPVAGLMLWAVGLRPTDAGPQQPGAPRSPRVRVVDLRVGETQQVKLCDGKTASVKLLDLKETRDSVRSAVRRAEVTVEVNGRKGKLVSATYHLPTTLGAVQIDCPITRGYYSNTNVDAWGLVKDARLRLWPADSPLTEPGTFLYPVKQRWFASATQMANEPTFVDGVERPWVRKIYYHSGEDIGGAEGLVEVVAATDGLVVSAGLEVLKEHKSTAQRETPVAPRYDVVYLLDGRGWYYRYSHLQVIDARIKPGRTVQKGDRIGVLGKEGASGGWSHLHFEIKSLQPSGKWGTQASYAFLWESYRRQYKPKLQAVARPHHLLWAGEKAVLDGSRSWSAAGKVAKYEWEFSDGTRAEGATVERAYPRAGQFSEVLKVTDADGRVDYDFAVVQVIDRTRPKSPPPGIHAAYAPTFGIRPGDPVTFKVRTFGTTHGKEVWDFGDGSPRVEVRSDGNVKPLARDGYAVTVHRYAKAGHYLVRVERSNEQGEKGVARLQVRVEGEE
jgi:murein DD-endopeptidase MepM/ murein hydrolase activator NlpD